MNLKIIINISLIILFSITIINSAESKELESKFLQEKKQNLEELRYEEEHGRLHKIE